MVVERQDQTSLGVDFDAAFILCLNLTDPESNWSTTTVTRNLQNCHGTSFCLLLCDFNSFSQIYFEIEKSICGLKNNNSENCNVNCDRIKYTGPFALD